MKRIVAGATLVLFGLAPAVVFADCGVDHAAMASAAPPAKTQVVKTDASKASAKVAKVTPTVSKQADGKTAASAQSKRPEVVAKTN